jgi:teichuronic acid biosynthesis glycosyltransferase TuaG
MVEQSPLVSVVIPVFNRFRYVLRSIDSVIAQTYKNWEIIIVDDCSLEIFNLDNNYLNNYRIKIIRNEKNLGSGLSRQKALEIATGNYVAFLDSDDYYHENFLQKTVNRLNERNLIIGVYVFSQFTLNNEIKSKVICNNIMPTLFEHKRPWTTCSWLWRRCDIASWKSLRTNQDSLFEIDNALINNNINCIPEVLCFIDKDTKENSMDLVGNYKSELNRNFVVNYSIDVLNKFRESDIYPNIRKFCFKRLSFVTIKLIKYGEKKLIVQNALIMLKNRKLYGIFYLLVPFILNKNKQTDNNEFIKSIFEYFLIK